MAMLAAFACGLLFGLGLLISGMTQPAKILDFLDVARIAQGTWDPTLALVMATALAIAVPGFRYARRRGHPALASKCFWPTRTDIDAQLIAGAVLLAVGIVGFRPVAPRWSDIVLIAVGACLVAGAAVLFAVAVAGRRLWRRRRPKAELEAARWEAFCRYLTPARYDDELEVHTRATLITPARVRFDYEIRVGGTGATAATGHTVHAALGASGKPCRLPERVRLVMDPGDRERWSPPARPPGDDERLQ